MRETPFTASTRLSLKPKFEIFIQCFFVAIRAELISGNEFFLHSDSKPLIWSNLLPTLPTVFLHFSEENKNLFNLVEFSAP